MTSKAGQQVDGAVGLAETVICKQECARTGSDEAING